MDSHIGIGSCLELQQAYKLMNKSIKKFKGKSELDKSFNKSVDFFCDKLLLCWFSRNKEGIPKCHGCSKFVKESKVTLLMERKIDFSEQSNPSNDNEKEYEKLAKKLKTFTMSNTNKLLLPKVKLRRN